ncbi:hypothetical protein F2P81_001328 [Scophthalmus maximus]|uniref:Endonuclease/exonuclease/phosphatase domain-containing protein n=1 Tax=Scophthalmus maximus TaxID=52904 RepID=A0A6A4TR05_SCOMX|nr:hypothetical protein F2P81_001328 [Scophthalmus maximus]
MGEKEAIVKLREDGKSIRAIAQTLAITSTTTWNVLKKKETTGVLSNRRRTGTPRKTTAVDDRNIVRAVKKDSKTAVGDISNNLQRAGLKLCAISPSVLILGDFNFHIDNINCKSATEFLELLNCFNFSQHVNFPIHTHGHILDLVCSTGLTVNHLSSLNLHISDDLAIITDINIPIPIPKDKRKMSPELHQMKFRKCQLERLQ